MNSISSAREQADQLRELLERIAQQPDLLDTLDRICRTVVEALAAGGKVLTLGNGGSATDALHLAEELIGRYRTDRAPLPAVCLSADVSALTCIANDFGYDAVFERQVQALGRPGDVVIGFSTSGNSPNVNRAFGAARAAGATTIGMLGKTGGAARDLVDLAWVVPHDNTARIQELHTLALHAICEAVEARFGLSST
ncbi:MAG TPA: SIS domain-containing protein [Candidatus Sumerlaeota bacterium]|nr:MAG: Phosphoheptose isomerase 1 [candidate division BRC1 bacterium ADurb.BinA292]HOE95224.1 SIS domain-containing protein [Candidatus Sumerlaeota bacterium]HOR29719.1 SIS domain-containing protein [Candidatus Sumerlaeota bacterium]HPK01418.1 SIS domain-containing protein [Candidatus Sumerlaeota bacterium]